MNWFIPCNPNDYDYFNALNSLIELDWSQKNSKFTIGDYVYIYASKPIQKIVAKAVITKTNILKDEMIDDSKYVKSSSLNNDSRYFRLKLIKFYNNEELSYLDYRVLKENGLKVVQGRFRINKCNELNKYMRENNLL